LRPTNGSQERCDLGTFLKYYFKHTYKWHLQVGRCIYFNGQQQYALVPPINFAEFEQGFSISFWFYYEGNSATDWWTRIIDFGNGREQNNIIFGRHDYTNNSAVTFWRNGSYQLFDMIDGFPANRWMHYVMVVERSSGSAQWKVYQNGVLVRDVPDLYPEVQTNINYIGKDHWGDSAYIVGKLDSFGIFPSPLDQEHVRMLFESSTAMVSVVIC
jgi:hypothetical protein